MSDRRSDAGGRHAGPEAGARREPGTRDGRRPAGDGRHVDPALGTLSGEGSGQRVERRDEAYPTPAPGGGIPPGGWRPRRPAGAAGGDADDLPTYYDRPAIKEPVWIWSVPVYFVVGGAAGACAALGAAAQTAGGPALRPLVARCRRLAAAGGAVGSVLLVLDLGRPERFLNMLRVLRPTSPMSVGSWTLAAFSGAAAGAALLARARGRALRRAGDLLGAAAGLLGPPLAAYPAVLLANTAVPVWIETRRTLPALFVASGASTAASLLEAVPAPRPAERVLRPFGLAAKAAVVVAMAAAERDAGEVDRVGRALSEGVPGDLWKAARWAALAGLGLSLLPPGGRAKRALGAALGVAGALALRFAVVRAGHASARDPRATFAHQRRRRGAGETRSASPR